ncbi:MAG: sigma-54-dependent Fis family transcriptional regulator [bacterium]|nr:MAG: sigma-54-dependent Fis family transcriptional regulator [bacterium]
MKILVVDDHANVRVVLQDMLEREGYAVVTAGSFDEAVPAVEGDDLRVIITDLKMPGRSGMDLLSYCRERRPEVPVVMITGHGNVEAAVTAIKGGAFDFISKPVDEAELLNVISMALTESEQNRDIVSDFFHREEEFDTRFIGSTRAVEEIFRTVSKIAPTDSTVLITGETGVGKELVARAIHLGSGRREAPFIKVHCAAVPENLVESELFGHEKGAFTGAVSSKPGRFEIADGGTLFLDEVGEIPGPVQVKLLTFLQDRAFERVGGVRTIRVDTRIVEATNRDLQAMVKSGDFRADLYFRLHVIPIAIPPLRERRDDIPSQADHFMKRFASRYGKKIRAIPPGIMAAFLAYDWPGNTRELENVIERLVLLSEKGELSLQDLPVEVRGVARAGHDADFRDRVDNVARSAEKRLITKALEQTGQNRTRAAEILGISRRTLQKKIKEYGL